MSEQDAMEVPFRIDGGGWSNTAPAVEPPVVEQGSLYQRITWALEDMAAALEPLVNQIGIAIAGFVEAFVPYFPNHAGLPVAEGVVIVKPAKGGKTFFCWRDDRWVPVHRERGRGWVWSE